MGANAEAHVLKLTEVHKEYGKVSALNGLNLNLARGDVYGFLGRNGAGKSTTLRIVMGITRPTRGAVSLFGAPVRSNDVRPRRRVGYVAQEQHFYDWMTPERLGRFVGAFYPTWDAARFGQLIRDFDVPPRKIRTLSGGTKVKLALALALAHRPELLVLDEPTAGLDAVVRREFIEIVRDLRQTGEHAMLLSSHHIDEVEAAANRVGIVEQGRMRYEGSLAELGARVRCFSLDPTEFEALLGPVGSADIVERVRVLLGALPLRLLRHRQRGAHTELVFWFDDPLVVAPLRERLVMARPVELSLEDCFIELVTQNSRSIVEAAAESPTPAAASAPA